MWLINSYFLSRPGSSKSFLLGKNSLLSWSSSLRTSGEKSKAPNFKNFGKYIRQYSTYSENSYNKINNNGLEEEKSIIFNSLAISEALEEACEEIKCKYIDISGVYKLTNKNDLTRFYIGSSNNLARRMEEYNKLTKGLRSPHSKGELEISKIPALDLSLEFIYITTPQLSLVYEQYAIIKFRPTINSNLKVIPRVNPQWGNKLEHAISVIKILLSLFPEGSSSEGYNRLNVFLQTF